MNLYEIDALVVGTISEIRTYGAIITFEDRRKGLLHIKQISDSYISSISTYLKLDAPIKVRIMEIDEFNGFMKLSLKTVPHQERIIFEQSRKEGNINPSQIDFTMLQNALPGWINKAMEEITNDQTES